MKLGILDQSIVHYGQTSRQALDETLNTLQLAEQCGYDRFWVSEHHNSTRVAGSSPAVLMAHLASRSTQIRIGSGGVMLPNHSEYKVAENFRMLETLYPGRIDLGMGRAPGGDRIAASLLNPSNQFEEGDYLRQLEYLQHFLQDTAGTQNGRVYAMPQPEGVPQQWILSSSGGSSEIAARFGMGLGVAKFINGFVHPSIVEQYKRAFQPSETFQKPYVMLSILVLCGKEDAQAAEMRKYVDYMFLQMAQGNMNSSQPYDYIMDYSFSPRELDIVSRNEGRVVSGTANDVKAQLDQLSTAFEADEIMATNMSGNLELRRQSFELLAEVYGVKPVSSQPQAVHDGTTLQ